MTGTRPLDESALRDGPLGELADPSRPRERERRRVRPTIAVVAGGTVFLLILAIRIRGIDAWFWMLEDQIRDWSIALRPFGELPLVGPPTHFGGYTIGPAFYWILWVIRVSVGTWFDNLPHGGGIGQAMLHSTADVLLLFAVWRRTQSASLALTCIVLLATAAYDLCLAAIVWNPVVGSTLAKIATALVLLQWHTGGPARVAATALVAWSAVHAYTGAVYVAVGVLAAIVLTPALRRDWSSCWRNFATAVVSVGALQLPYVLHRLSSASSHDAMAAVTGGVVRILSGAAQPRWDESASAYAAALHFIQDSPFDVSLAIWLVAVAGTIVAVIHRRDVSLLLVTLFPQLLAILGYSFFLGELDHYYYLSLMPAVVLTVLLPVARLGPRLGHAAGVLLLLASLALVPARMQFAATMHRMPEYAALADASRALVRDGRPVREIRAAFPLHPTTDPAFLYRILGGVIEPTSTWVAIIESDGAVEWRQAGTTSPEASVGR